MNYNPRRLFVASCLALITSAFSFMIRGDISDPLAADFGMSKTVVGDVMGAAFLGMAASMLVFSPICDSIGMGRVLALAWLSHLVGILGTIFAKDIAAQGFIQSAMSGLGNAASHLPLVPHEPGTNTAFWVLWIATFLVGAGNGLVEVAINPLSATVYPDQKTHKLNVLHAWWPGGLILSGCLALFFVNPLFGEPAQFFKYKIDPEKLGVAHLLAGLPIWKFKMGLLLVPLLLYGLLSVGQRFPATERVQANISTGTMFLQVLRPMFLLWAFCMLLTASTELGTNQWQESVLSRTVGADALATLGGAKGIGTLFLIWTSLLMFVLRFFAGPLAHRFSPVGMLFFSSMLAAGGLYWLSFADNVYMAFAAITVFGLGIAYYWPTMLGVTAERFPKGGALVMGLMGCVGNLAISQALPLMGAIYDSYTVNSLPSEVRQIKVSTSKAPEPILDKDGKPMTEIPLVETNDVPKWVPPEVSHRIYPAELSKVQPAARGLLADKSAEEAIEKAEIEGARYAFRWVSVMPAVLIVIFGLIVLVDKMRGGYRQVHLTTAPVEPRRPVHAAPPGAWPKDLTR
jgi:MFS family permease